MATGREIFGGCGGEIDVLVEVENSKVWLCYGWKYLGFILGVKSGSMSGVEVGDGARYWMVLLMLWASLEN